MLAFLFERLNMSNRDCAAQKHLGALLAQLQMQVGSAIAADRADGELNVSTPAHPVDLQSVSSSGVHDGFAVLAQMDNGSGAQGQNLEGQETRAVPIADSDIEATPELEAEHEPEEEQVETPPKPKIMPLQQVAEVDKKKEEPPEDRLTSILKNLEKLREAISFPRTGTFRAYDGIHSLPPDLMDGELEYIRYLETKYGDVDKAMAIIGCRGQAPGAFHAVYRTGDFVRDGWCSHR